MTRVRGSVLVPMALALWLGACAGPQLMGLNTDLNRLFEQREKFRNATDNAGFAQFVAADGELERLTDTALEAARGASDAKSKISYYRISATAGWQRLDNRALTIATEGSKVCNDSNGFDLSPRDCVMLLVIPNLIVNDAWAQKLAQIQSEAGPPGLPAKYRVVVMDLLDSYNGLVQGEARARASRAPPTLATVIVRQQTIVKGNLATLMKLFVAKGTSADNAEIASICNDIRGRAADAVPPACATFR
jgi:hypothetical protein